jgi:hypothetical protein
MMGPSTQNRWGILFSDFFILAKQTMLSGKLLAVKLIAVKKCEVIDMDDTESKYPIHGAATRTFD